MFDSAVSTADIKAGFHLYHYFTKTADTSPAVLLLFIKLAHYRNKVLTVGIRGAILCYSKEIHRGVAVGMEIKMKKIIALILAILMLACCTACGSAKAPADRLEKIKAQGYIQLATEPYFAPYEFIDPSLSGDAQYVGLDIELAKAIAEKLGVELKIVPLDFTAVLAGIVDGKYDMAISAIAYSPVREESMALSEGYFLDNEDGYGFLTRAEDADKYKSIEDLKDAVVITQSGSVQEGIYNDQVKPVTGADTKLVANMTDGYLAVAEGKADVCIVSVPSASLYAEANGGLTVPEFRFDTDKRLSSTVVACPKADSQSLMAVINEVIAELESNGTIQGWNEQYTEYAKSLGL